MTEIIGIMSGGVGKRLWPLSQDINPKQLIQLVGESSTMQRLVRVMNNADFNVNIISNILYRHELIRQMNEEDLKYNRVIWESESRNTAYAAAILAWDALMKDGLDSIVVIMPSDHYWGDEESLIKQIRYAIDYVKHKDVVCCFGIRKEEFSKEYGYIKIDNANLDDLQKFSGSNITNNEYKNLIYNVTDFIEKPSSCSLDGAYDAKSFMMNSGIYCTKSAFLLEQFKEYASYIYYDTLAAVKNSNYLGNELFIKKY